MADLNSLFQNLGPTGGALVSGLTTGQDLASAFMQDNLRQAQLQKTQQDIAQGELMNPLLIQGKKQEIASAELEAKQKRQDYYNGVLGSLIPELEKAPAPARHALMEQRLKDAGLPLDQADRDWAQTHNGDELVSKLKKAHEWQVTQSAKYRTEMDKQKLHNQGQLDVAREQSRSREAVAAAKVSAKATDIVSQVQSGKLSAEKAAVAFDVMAATTDDPEKKIQYQQMAGRYESLAKQLRAAGNAGKVDVGAATGLPTLDMPSVLTPGATSPATPTKPSLPPGWSVK
jgi:hypothetical protein